MPVMSPGLMGGAFAGYRTYLLDIFPVGVTGNNSFNNVKIALVNPNNIIFPLYHSEPSTLINLSSGRSWGVENSRISLRSWLCGEGIYIAPCSFVSHTNGPDKKLER